MHRGDVLAPGRRNAPVQFIDVRDILVGSPAEFILEPRK